MISYISLYPLCYMHVQVWLRTPSSWCLFLERIRCISVLYGLIWIYRNFLHETEHKVTPILPKNFCLLSEKKREKKKKKRTKRSKEKHTASNQHYILYLCSHTPLQDHISINTKTCEVSIPLMPLMPPQNKEMVESSSTSSFWYQQSGSQNVGHGFSCPSKWLE